MTTLQLLRLMKTNGGIYTYVRSLAREFAGEQNRVCLIGKGHCHSISGLTIILLWAELFWLDTSVAMLVKYIVCPLSVNSLWNSTSARRPGK